MDGRMADELYGESWEGCPVIAGIYVINEDQAKIT